MILIDDPWISTEDRLPDLLQKVLFHWVFAAGNRNISMGYRCEEGWDIYLPCNSYGVNPENILVTHWMELPKFPYCLESTIQNFINSRRTLFKMEITR